MGPMFWLKFIIGHCIIIKLVNYFVAHMVNTFKLINSTRQQIGILEIIILFILSNN